MHGIASIQAYGTPTIGLARRTWNNLICLWHIPLFASRKLEEIATVADKHKCWFILKVVAEMPEAETVSRYYLVSRHTE